MSRPVVSRPVVSRPFVLRPVVPSVDEAGHANTPDGHAHARLRQATHARHAALDALLRESELTRHAGYVRYLRMNEACAAIEPALTQAGIHRLLPDWDQRQRRFALARDLKSMGLSPGPVAVPELAPDTGTLFGWSYVLEGSRLGAAMIARMIEAEGDPGPRAAMEFLRHGAGMPLWAGFRSALSRIDRDPDAIGNACAAALAAFACFLAHARENDAAAP